MHPLGISIFFSTRQTICKTIYEKNNFKCCHQTSCFHVSFLYCKLVEKRVSHMQYIYALYIPILEGDPSQTNIPLRSHKLTVIIKRPTKFFYKSTLVSFHVFPHICCVCVHPFLQSLHRCFVHNLSSLLWICNSMSWEMLVDLLNGSTYELHMPTRSPGLGLSRDIAEPTSQVGHVYLQDLGTTIHWPQYDRMIYKKCSQHSLPIPFTNRIFHVSLYGDIQIPCKVITAYLRFQKDPSVGVASKYKARWMLDILRFTAIPFLQRSNGRSGRRNYSNFSSSTDLLQQD